MLAALALVYKLLPLYATVALGWVAGRYLDASGRHIAGIMMYIVTPSVIFAGVMNAPRIRRMASGVSKNAWSRISPTGSKK